MIPNFYDGEFFNKMAQIDSMNLTKMSQIIGRFCSNEWNQVLSDIFEDFKISQMKQSSVVRMNIYEYLMHLCLQVTMEATIRNQLRYHTNTKLFFDDKLFVEFDRMDIVLFINILRHRETLIKTCDKYKGMILLKSTLIQIESIVIDLKNIKFMKNELESMVESPDSGYAKINQP